MKLEFKLRPRPLVGTSPTRAESLRSCFLRAAFDAEPHCQHLVFRGPAARLGTVCHKILELTARGHFDDLAPSAIPDPFQKLWTALIQEQAAEAQGTPLEQHLGQPERWPYYQLKRALLLARVQQLVASRVGLRGGWVPGPGHVTGVEKRIRGFGGQLAGRIDHVVWRAGHVEIEDYKTGPLADPAAGDASQLRDAYRRQLLLYAALYWDSTGSWPHVARAVSLDGSEATILVDPPEVLALVDETLAILSRYNEMAPGNSGPDQLATPSSQACRWCPYKALCPAFWHAVSIDWDLGGAVHVAGMIVNNHHSGAGGHALEVQVTGGTLPDGIYWLRGLTAERFPDIADFKRGCSIRILAARLAGPATPFELRPTLSTQLWWS